MIPLLTAEEMRELDRYTIEEVGLPGTVLMETAGRGVFRHAWEAYRDRLTSKPVAVICGRGNNGGDGFVVARCLRGRGAAVRAILLGSRDRVAGDAATHLGAYLRSGGSLLEVGEGNRTEARTAVEDAGVVIDAILGTGLSDDVRGLPAEAIAWVSEGTAPVVSVDVPSGVSSDTGRVCGNAVQADLTVTFAYRKRGHYMHPGASRCGRIEVVDIGVPQDALRRISPGLYLDEEDDFRDTLHRPADSHKGTFGHVVVLGGGPGKTGAPGLAAWAALRCGAGLATVAWPAVGGAEARLPLELMTLPLQGRGEWEDGLWELSAREIQGADALVVGPGMGTGAGAGRFLARLLEAFEGPLVLDADGLNLLAENPGIWPERSPPAVLTPHPGEAARLLGISTGQVQQDRLGAVRTIADRFGCAVVLKGAATLVTSPGGPTYLLSRGNAGMATAGTGDVLSGVVGSLLARGVEPLHAARMGAFVHAQAGDRAAARVGEEGMVATDLLRELPAVVEDFRS